MLKTIAEVAPELVNFIDNLNLSLSNPQKQHVAQVADALITTEGSKTRTVSKPHPHFFLYKFKKSPKTGTPPPQNNAYPFKTSSA